MIYSQETTSFIDVKILTIPVLQHGFIESKLLKFQCNVSQPSLSFCFLNCAKQICSSNFSFVN